MMTPQTLASAPLFFFCSAGMRSLAWKRRNSHTVDVPGSSGSCCAYLRHKHNGGTERDAGQLAAQLAAAAYNTAQARPAQASAGQHSVVQLAGKAVGKSKMPKQTWSLPYSVSNDLSINDMAIEGELPLHPHTPSPA